MKMCFKAAASAIAAFGLLVSGAYAMTDVNGVVTDTGNVKINVSTDCGSSLYGIYILRPGRSADEINIEQGTSDAIAALETIEVNPTGSNTFSTGELSFKFPANAENGVYTAVIGGGESLGREIRLCYGTAEDLADAKKAITGITENNIESVIKEYNDKAWSLDLGNSFYQAGKNAVHKSMIKMIADGASAEDVAVAFSRACAFADLKTCDNAEVIDKLLMYEKLMSGSYSEVLSENKEEMAESFCNLRADESMDTPEELDRIIKASRAMVLLNNASRDNVIQVLKDNNEIFGLNFTGDYTKVNSYSLAKKIEASEGNKYTSLGQVRTKFENSIAELIGSNSGSGSTGGSGGNGKGSTLSYSSNGQTAGTVITAEEIGAYDDKLQYTDLDNSHWASPYIMFLAKNGVMQGDGNGTFRPDDRVLREEFLKLVVEGLELKTEDNIQADFSDVDRDAWYADYVDTGVFWKIVNGVDDNRFGTGEPITREEAAVMIKRALDAKTYTLKETAQKKQFADSESISDFALEAVSVLQKAEIIDGYENGEFRPKDHISRAETAKIIYSVIKAIG